LFSQVLPHPPILRALDQAKKKLSAHPDIEVVDFEPFKHDEGYALARELYFPEGPVTVKKFLKEAGEPMHTLTEYGMAPPTGEHTTLELFDLYGKREAYRRAHLADWVKQGCEWV
jgi:amidase